MLVCHLLRRLALPVPGKASRAPPLVALLIAALAYLVAALAAPPGFLDGLAPPAPYRWVSPPPAFRAGNQPPLSGHTTIRLGPHGEIPPGTAFTRDGQASMSWGQGDLQPLPGRSVAVFVITPQSRFPSPGKIQLSTNVYCYSSTTSVARGHRVLITLAYAAGIAPPAAIYTYQDGGPWRRLGSTVGGQPFTISVYSPSLGCFAAAAEPSPASGSGPLGAPGQDLPVLVAALILLLLLAALPLIVLRGRK